MIGHENGMIRRGLVSIAKQGIKSFGLRVIAGFALQIQESFNILSILRHTAKRLIKKPVSPNPFMISDILYELIR